VRLSAYELERQNGDTFWSDAIAKEMHDTGIASFEIMDDDQPLPVDLTGHHMVFDVKMDYTCKARWVLDGHKTTPPEKSTYTGFVSRDSVGIALTYAALNDLDVWAADIHNAYLQVPSSQKDCVICGPEFGLENVDKRALMRQLLYGGKTAGADFHNHLRECMRHLNFTSSSLADPDVWMCPAKKANGSECYDVLVISENGKNVLRSGIGKYFELKEESIGPPKLYLGGHMRLVELKNGAKAWAFSSSQYVQAAVKNAETYLEKTGGKLPRKAETPTHTSYRPGVLSVLNWSLALDSGTGTS
jgi:hypothetical protein